MFRFTRPDGDVLSDTVPRVMLEGCPMDLILQANYARGLCIDDRTGVCKWDGVPMDASMAVEGVLQTRGSSSAERGGRFRGSTAAAAAVH